MSEFAEVLEGAFALIVGGLVMFMFGSVVTNELFNFTLIGLLYLFGGIVLLVTVAVVAVQVMFQ